jgi:hypothetical protein
MHGYIAAFLLLVTDCLSVQLRSSPSNLFMSGAPNCTELYPGKCAPYAVIIGEDKCGTNAVASYVKAMGLSKQTNEGCRRQYLARGWCGEVNWNFQRKPLNTLELRKDYGVTFPDTDWKSSAAFDKSTVYFRQATQPGYIEAFKAALPDSKIIAVLCDPVDRVWSRMQMLREKDGIQSGSKCPWNFQENLTADAGHQVLNHTAKILEQIDKGVIDRKIPECNDCQLLCMVLRTGGYAEAIKAWSDAYGSNFRYFISEEIKSNPNTFIDELFDLLKYPGAPPRDQIKDVGEVHTRENDKLYWKKDGEVWNSFRSMLAPRYKWDEVLSQRMLSWPAWTPPLQALDRLVHET